MAIDLLSIGNIHNQTECAEAIEKLRRDVSETEPSARAVNGFVRDPTSFRGCRDCFSPRSEEMASPSRIRRFEGSQRMRWNRLADPDAFSLAEWSKTGMLPHTAQLVCSGTTARQLGFQI